ncbi:MAG: ABC transporter substrate-binding protein [Oscillibacter sp.]|nr:ABC transporter substrate-binding protein [Oscillibacter sp.]MEA4992434.1 ABC transporter substrate-binding protein [Oscillibacter sp.]
MKRITALLLAAMLTLTVLTGCGTQASAGQSGGEENGSLREINVVLDWYPNALHTFIYTAIQRGYYKDEGLEVNIRFPSNENDALSLVAAGKAEIGLYYQQDVIQAVADQGVGIKSIGAVVQSPLNIILSLADKNIHSPKDLEGKTVGYAGTALSESLVKAMMDANGADFGRVNLVNVGFDLMSSMTTGNVDATIGCLVNHEVPQMEEEGFDVNYFMVNKYGIPNYYEAVFLANDKMIEAEPEVLGGFLRASAKGFADFQADPDGCLQILLDNQNEENFPLSPSVETQSCQTLLPLMETEDTPFLSQSAEIWQANIDWMYSVGLIHEMVDPAQVMAEIDF